MGGESMTFRFWFRSDTCCQSSTWATDDFEGFYLDDFGILIPNYSSNGSWLSLPSTSPTMTRSTLATLTSTLRYQMKQGFWRLS